MFGLVYVFQHSPFFPASEDRCFRSRNSYFVWFIIWVYELLLSEEYLDLDTGTEKEESSPLQPFCSQNCIWVVQAWLKKISGLNYSSYICPSGWKQQLATSFVLGNAVCIPFALVTSFSLAAISVIWRLAQSLENLVMLAAHSACQQEGNSISTTHAQPPESGGWFLFP